jgi:hypothetical protein
MMLRLAGICAVLLWITVAAVGTADSNMVAGWFNRITALFDTVAPTPAASKYFPE